LPLTATTSPLRTPASAAGAPDTRGRPAIGPASNRSRPLLRRGLAGFISRWSS
jgi:hypothetical protein